MWNWGDGSYTIECNDDVGEPLTYYIDELSRLLFFFLKRLLSVAYFFFVQAGCECESDCVCVKLCEKFGVVFCFFQQKKWFESSGFSPAGRVTLLFARPTNTHRTHKQESIKINN